MTGRGGKAGGGLQSATAQRQAAAGGSQRGVGAGQDGTAAANGGAAGVGVALVRLTVPVPINRTLPEPLMLPAKVMLSSG